MATKRTTNNVAKDKKKTTKSIQAKVVRGSTALNKSNTSRSEKDMKSKMNKSAGKTPNANKALSLDKITDQDILSMPESDYMNELQLMFFKLKLEQMKHSILTSAEKTTDNLRAEAAVFPDPADRATVEEEHALELRTRDRERKLLKKVEQSIHRIEGGEYGYCEETGEPIGVARLIARPTASLSIEAQQRREQKQKLFGD